MKRVFEITRVRWTVITAWILTVVGAVLTASLSFNAFNTQVFGLTATQVNALPTSAQIDKAARTKYLDEIAAKKKAAEEAEEAERLKQAANAQKISATRTTAQNTSSQPTCDRLIIPKIGLNSCLTSVGLTADDAVDVHPNLPAWFNQSSRVGTNGGTYNATFIDGHRSGIFRNLGRLAVGDQITVSFVSGESYTYIVRVTEVTSLSATDMRKALSIYGGAAQGLNLMTCEGAYSSSLGTAESRLTIYATR